MKLTLTVLAAAALLAAPISAVHSQTLATLESGGNLLSLTSPSGQAAPSLQFIGGYGHLDFSAGQYALSGNTEDVGAAIGVFNVVHGNVQGTLGAVVVEQVQENEIGEIVRVSSSWQTPAATAVSMVKDGANAGQMQTLSLAGGLSLSAPRVSGTATGGAAQLSNIRVDLANGQVIADLTGTRLAVGTKPAASYSSPNTVMWTVGSLAGPAQIAPDALLAVNPATALTTAGLTVVEPRWVTTYQPMTCYASNGYGYYPYSCPIALTTSLDFSAVRADIQLNDLTLTSEGATFLTGSMGLLATGQDALAAANFSSPGKWGRLKVSAFFRVEDAAGFLPGIPASIPEPSTYALMGVGLLGIWGVSRRAARQPST